MSYKAYNKHKQKGQPKGCLCCERYVPTKKLLAFSFFVLLSPALGAWEAEWTEMELPGIVAQAHVAVHLGEKPHQESTFWVYLIYPEGRFAERLNGQKYTAQLLEWTIDCEKQIGYMGTIRYSNHDIPGWYDDFLLTHPVESEYPSLKQVEVICELGT